FFQAEDGIRDRTVTGVQTCALPISASEGLDSLPLVKQLRAFVRGHPWWQGLITLLLPIAGVAYKVWSSLKSFGLDPKRLIPHSRSEERRVGKECRCWMGKGEYNDIW